MILSSIATGMTTKVKDFFLKPLPTQEQLSKRDWNIRNIALAAIAVIALGFAASFIFGSSASGPSTFKILASVIVAAIAIIFAMKKGNENTSPVVVNVSASPGQPVPPPQPPMQDEEVIVDPSQEGAIDENDFTEPMIDQTPEAVSDSEEITPAVDEVQDDLVIRGEDEDGQGDVEVENFENGSIPPPPPDDAESEALFIDPSKELPPISPPPPKILAKTFITFEVGDNTTYPRSGQEVGSPGYHELWGRDVVEVEKKDSSFCGLSDSFEGFDLKSPNVVEYKPQGKKLADFDIDSDPILGGAVTGLRGFSERSSSFVPPPPPDLEDET